jgi:Glycosyltransferase family 87
VEASRASWSRPAEAPFALAAVLAAAAAFLVAWALIHQGFWDDEEIVDTPVYEKYGDWMAEGRVPYRDFRPEYPPLALPVFVVPSLVAGADASHDEYRRVFEWLMAASGLAVLVLMAATLGSLGASPTRLVAALAFAGLFPLALGTVVLTRFDLWPAALVAGALAALVSFRDRLAFGLLGAAVAAKLYGAVLLPVAVVWVWRRRGRREALVCLGVFAGVLAVAYVPFLVLGAGGVVESVSRQLGRPLQLESLGSAVLLALHSLAGLDVEMRASHGSQNVGGSLGSVVGVAQTLVQVGVLVAVWIAWARGPMERERLVRYAAASVLAFVALGKVLSPQFLIWLVPLVPLVCGRRGLLASALLGLALVLTQLWFPFRYWDWVRTFDGGVTTLVLARDLILIAALAALLLPRPPRLFRPRPAA